MEVEFKTDAKGLPANCRRSSELFGLPGAADELTGAAAVGAGAGAAAACDGGADTPKRSRMFGVLLSAAEPPVGGSGAAAKGLVAFCLSYKNTKNDKKHHTLCFQKLTVGIV